MTVSPTSAIGALAVLAIATSARADTSTAASPTSLDGLESGVWLVTLALLVYEPAFVVRTVTVIVALPPEPTSPRSQAIVWPDAVHVPRDDDTAWMLSR